MALGYCTDTIIINGRISESKDPGTGQVTQWDIFLQIMHNQTCTERSPVLDIAIMNEIGSEVRHVNILDQKNCYVECTPSVYQRSCGAFSHESVLISQSGENTPLPPGYKEIFDNLEYWAVGGVDEDGGYFESAADADPSGTYAENSPTVLMNYIYAVLSETEPRAKDVLNIGGRCNNALKVCEVCPEIVDIEL